MHFDDRAANPGKIKIATLKRILPFFSAHKKSFLIASLMVILATAIFSSLPLVFRYLIDDIIPSGIPSQIIIVGLAYLFLLILNGGLDYFKAIIVGYMGIDIVNDMKEKILNHIMQLSIRFFDDNPPGVLISRIESDTQKLYMLFSQVGLQLLAALLNLSIAIIIMVTVNFRLSLFVMVIIPVFMVGTYIVFKKMRPLFKEDRALYAKIAGFCGEHVPAIPLLRNLNNINWSINKFRDINENKRRFESKIFAIEQIVWFVMMLMPQISITMILFYSVESVKTGAITIGTIWMFIQYMQMAIHPLIMASEQIGELQRAFGAADRIFDILDKETEIVNPEKPEKFIFNKKISFDNVTFSYDGKKTVLKDLSFEINMGDTIAIVGPTGSGKTTIINLICRFYDPQKGKILIDGQDISSFDKDSLRENMALILQDIFLFQGNILDNLRVLREDIDDETAIKAAKSTGIEELILKMPKGYQTQLSEDGGNLSFGERQLMSFSRAMTFDPEILIMDEATSSVDPYTEAKIQRSLDKLLKGRTSIIVAHRLSTIEHADKIIVLKDGSIIESGGHKDLINAKSFYANLYKQQMGSSHEGDILI